MKRVFKNAGFSCDQIRGRATADNFDGKECCYEEWIVNRSNVGAARRICRCQSSTKSGVQMNPMYGGRKTAKAAREREGNTSRKRSILHRLCNPLLLFLQSAFEMTVKSSTRNTFTPMAKFFSSREKSLIAWSRYSECWTSRTAESTDRQPHKRKRCSNYPMEGVIRTKRRKGFELETSRIRQITCDNKEL